MTGCRLTHVYLNVFMSPYLAAGSNCVEMHVKVNLITNIDPLQMCVRCVGLFVSLAFGSVTIKIAIQVSGLFDIFYMLFFFFNKLQSIQPKLVSI